MRKVLRSASGSPTMAPNTPMRAIFGLGNPGKEYLHTRHNAGFLVVDELNHRLGGTFKMKKALHAEIAEVMVGGEKVLLVKPQTFMNESGVAAHAVMQVNGLKPADILVTYDDADLEFGAVRVRTAGSSGGQNGMKSILASLPADSAVYRVRLGIGRPANTRIPLEDWVLTKWHEDELPKLKEAVEKSAGEIENWLKRD